MNIEDRMSMLAAKKPREEVSELLLEGAQEIADLRRQCQVLSQKNDCPDPDNAARQNILTDEEREAISRELSWLQWCEDNRQIGDVGRKDIATLRGLLERLT
jgi:hypothetical protein